MPLAGMSMLKFLRKAQATSSWKGRRRPIVPISRS